MEKGGKREVIWVEAGLLWLPMITAGLLYGVLMLLREKNFSGRVLLRRFREFSGLLKGKRHVASWYQSTLQRLEKQGAAFHYGKWINPLRYLVLRIALGTMGAAVLVPVSPFWGMVAAVGLFFLPGGLLTYLNSKDNEQLLPELKLVYHALEIQIRAGVYVTDALTECYGSVRHRRLREALLQLAGSIVVKADVFAALERFQGSFDNRYVDSLCLILLQALESGQALELLKDIGEQIKDMEQTVLERKKNALDRSVTFYQLGVLAAVLGVSLYGCVTHMLRSAAGF